MGSESQEYVYLVYASRDYEPGVILGVYSTIERARQRAERAHGGRRETIKLQVDEDTEWEG